MTPSTATSRGAASATWQHLASSHRPQTTPALVRPGHLGRPGRLLGPRSRWSRWPWALPPLLLLFLLLLPLAGRNPADLDDATLVGPRGPGCIRLVVAVDRSESMEVYADAREGALRALLPWAERELRLEDELAVVDWASTAATTLPPTAIADAASAAFSHPQIDTSQTLLTPVVRELAGHPASTCRVHLVLVSDGQIPDVSSAAKRGPLASALIDQVSLLLPSSRMSAPNAFLDAFPYAVTRAFDGSDPAATGLAFAEAIARTTGQQVARA